MSDNQQNTNGSVLASGKEVIDFYCSKSIRLNKRGAVYIGLIIFSLVVGILAFVFAGSLNEQKIDSETEETLDRINRIAKRVVQEDTTFHMYYHQMDNGLADFVQALTDQQAPENAVLAASVRNSFDSFVTAQNDNTKQLRLMMDKAVADFEKAKEVSNDTYFKFFATLSTRIGIVFILFFLLQLLIRLYRYDTRLANYFDARAQALKLQADNPNISFDKIVAHLSPDGYDIGSPKTPTESLVNLLNALNQARK